MKKFIIPLIIAIAFVSCEDVVEVDLNDEDTDLYAVEAKITTEDNPFVFLTKGMKVNMDEPYTGISDAVVTISDDAVPSNEITLTGDPDNKGFYSVPEGIDYFGVTGRTYTVTIETEGTVLTASDKLSSVSPVDSVKIRPSLRGDGRFLAVFTYGQEPEGLGDYYKWDIYINDTLLHDASLMVVASDELVDGNYVDGLEIFTDFHDPHHDSERKLKFMDSVYVKQVSLSPFSYQYYYQMINQGNAGFLFSVPPANIKSNFTSSDGKTVLGLFTAHDVSTSNSVLIDESIEDQLRK